MYIIYISLMINKISIRDEDVLQAEVQRLGLSLKQKFWKQKPLNF